MYLLLGGEPDEEMLLEYLTKDGVYVRGADADDDYHLAVGEVLELGYDEAMSFLIVNPGAGELVATGGSNRKLSWKTEFLHHEPFLDRTRGSRLVDPFLSPVMVYQRPYQNEEFFTEAYLEAAGSEANKAVKRWHERVAGWCRRRATNVFGCQPSSHDLFPGQFVSLSVNNRWALPEAMRWLGAGRLFCERDYPIEQIRVHMDKRLCATYQMSDFESRSAKAEAKNFPEG